MAMPLVRVSTTPGAEKKIKKLTSCRVGCFINSNQSLGKLKHIVSKRNDDELRILRPVFDIVGNDRNISEIQRSVDFVHEVEWCRLEDMKRENQRQRAQSLVR